MPTSFSSLRILVLFGWISCAILASSIQAQETLPLHGNTGFEDDRDGDGWPDGWARFRNGSWEEEEGNHFVRLQSPAAGTMVMLYEEVAIPPGTKALRLTWRQRVSNLQVGKQAWFDARVLLEFLDAQRKKVGPTPGAVATRAKASEWSDRSTEVLVPENARTLKFMPSLFQVKAGTLDLDDVLITSIDPEPLRVAAEESAARRLAKIEAETKKRQQQAAKRLADGASLIPNGDFERDQKGRGWPDDWGRPKCGTWEEEDGNHFLRLSTSEPGVLNMVYRVIDRSKLADIKGFVEIDKSEQVKTGKTENRSRLRIGLSGGTACIDGEDGCYKTSVLNISNRGLCLHNVPKKMYKNVNPLKVLFRTRKKDYMVTAKPVWKKFTGKGYDVGARIDQIPTGWKGLVAGLNQSFTIKPA